ncbi:MAG: sugar phosphate isomerase/epimerase [Clostridia bacterium]|nr:sugar phosphate isomerase/epimerase [Clostridia bacterium]
MDIGIEYSVLSSGYRRYGERRFEVIREHGFTYLDYGMSTTSGILYDPPMAEAEKFLREEKRRIEEAGLGISQVHGPWRYPPLDGTPEDRAERLEKMERSLWMTSVLGCKNWIIHPLMPFTTKDMDLGKEKETWEINADFFPKVLEIAKSYDITICFENMPMRRFSISTPEDILRFVHLMNDDHFKVCLDTGHVNVYDSLSIGDSVRLLGKELRTLHVHDNSRGMDLHQMPFFGTLNWKELADALYEIGYDGVFSLETAPPAALPDPLHDEAGRFLFRVANRIINE